MHSFILRVNDVVVAGTVTVSTKITAMPRPRAVSTFLEQAKNEHIPKK